MPYNMISTIQIEFSYKLIESYANFVQYNGKIQYYCSISINNEKSRKLHKLWFVAWIWNSTVDDDIYEFSMHFIQNRKKHWVNHHYSCFFEQNVWPQHKLTHVDMKTRGHLRTWLDWSLLLLKAHISGVKTPKASGWNFNWGWNDSIEAD